MTNTKPLYDKCITDILETLCPCVECICIPICRHKWYTTLFNDCCMLLGYEPHFDLIHQRNDFRIFYIEKLLQPTLWEYVLERGFSDSYLVSATDTYVREAYMPKITIGGERNPV